MEKRSRPLVAGELSRPALVTTYQRQASRALRYRIFARVADGWAGLNDPAPTSNDDNRAWASPYLQRLEATCSGAIAADQLSFVSAANALRNLTIALLAEDGTTTARIAAILAEQSEIEDRLLTGQLSDLAETGGERYESRDARLTRRRQTLRSELAALEAERVELEARRRLIAVEVRGHQDTVEAFWRALLVRVEAFQALYQRRAHTYVRWLNRRRRRLLSAPTMGAPAWVAQACPWLSEGID